MRKKKPNIDPAANFTHQAAFLGAGGSSLLGWLDAEVALAHA